MMLVILLLSFLFFIIGFILNESNAKYLLSGYNTMSVEEQTNFNLKSYLNFSIKLIFYYIFHFKFQYIFNFIITQIIVLSFQLFLKY